MRSIGVFFCASLLSIGALAQDSTKIQLDKLLASNDPADRELLVTRLQSLAASGTETNMSIAGSYYYRIKNVKASDSVFTAEIAKFPKGLEARIRKQQAITALKGLQDMEKAYVGFIADFPPGSYAALPFGEDRLPYDRVRITLAIGYAKERNLAKADFYAGLLEADFWKGKAYGDLANAFYMNGDLGNAALYQKKAVESAIPFLSGASGKSVTANFAASGYAEKCRVYAQLLFELHQYAGALNVIERVPASGPAFDFTYAEILAALDRNQEAYDRIEAAIRSGKGSAEMASLFKVLYVRVKGSDAGLDAYQQAIRAGVVNELRKKLTKNMLNEPAANFSLTDLQGRTVSLASLKGKIVILDFWAVWCVPCKASFPAMQMAIDKYKNDPNVVFLFIHTWERSKTPVADARAYMASVHYNFQVLMDMKDPETRANKVVDSYNVSSIPTKFVIDGKGNIRFRLTGFDGSNEAAVDEISMMIEIAGSSVYPAP